MNAPIVRLYGLLLLLFARPGRVHVATGRCSTPTSLKDNPAEPPPADRRADGQARDDQDRRRGDGRRELPGGRRQAPGLRAQLPAGLRVRKPGRLQLHPGRPDRDRALRERRPGRRAQRVHVDHRPAPRRPPGGRQRHPDDRRADAQRVATQALQSAIASTPGAAGRGGSVVALDPSTGAVKAMASVPGFDPNQVEDATGPQAAATRTRARRIVNRATQSTYPPGSTMKVVTAAAALDSGQFTPEHGAQRRARRR